MKYKKQTLKTFGKIRQFILKNPLFVALIITVCLAGFFFYQYQKTKKLLQNPNQQLQQETKDLIDKVGRLILLPVDELPTVATVSDKAKLINQPFFARAEDGDKLLVYTNNRKAILYRPSINKIIEAGPVTTGGVIGAASDSARLQPTPTVISTAIPKLAPSKIKLAIYNGTKISGLATLTEKQLQQKKPEIEVVKKADTRKDYSETLVVDLKGDLSNLTQELAQFVSGRVSSFPEGEASPAADILVILGQ